MPSRVNSPEWLRELSDRVLAGEQLDMEAIGAAFVFEQLARDAEYVEAIGRRWTAELDSLELSRFSGIRATGPEVEEAVGSEVAEPAV